MKITTIVVAAALAMSTGCAFAAGSGAGEVAAGRTVGTANSSAGARGGVSPRVAAPGGVSITTPGTTTGMGTGGPVTPGLNANGPCNGASSTTAGGAC